jgi:hypothetical protein
MNKRFNLKNLLVSLGIMGLATVGGGAVLAQSTATGSVVISLPNGTVQSASGQISLPSGYHYLGDSNGNFIVTPTIQQPVPGWTDPADEVANLQRITGLNINAGSIGTVADFEVAAADSLLKAGDGSPQALSNIVSIIRAYNPEGRFSSNTVQATAMGNTTVIAPNGTTYSVSGEVTLPSGLYYLMNGTEGALDVTPGIQRRDDTNPDTVFVGRLTIDAGEVKAPLVGGIPADFNSVATYWLRFYESGSQDLSWAVSIIRAGEESGLMVGRNRPQARAMGSTTVSLTNGATMSVSSEVTLPSGMYYGDGGAQLVVDPTYNGQQGTNELLIRTLSINPGAISDPSTRWDFNAAAASALTSAPSLSDQVSIIRAGSGNMGLE